jgi:hypothetical protein
MSEYKEVLFKWAENKMRSFQQPIKRILKVDFEPYDWSGGCPSCGSDDGIDISIMYEDINGAIDIIDSRDGKYYFTDNMASLLMELFKIAEEEESGQGQGSEHH